MGQGTKDVTQAQVRTDLSTNDKLMLVNAITKEVQLVELTTLGERIAPDTAIAPADYEDFFGL